jgi:hypothetical protein
VIVFVYAAAPGAYDHGGLLVADPIACPTVTVNVPVKPVGTVSANELCPPLHVQTLLWLPAVNVYVCGPTTGTCA